MAAIAQGLVLVNGSVAEKAARLVAPSDQLVVSAAARFVGRGGEKLEAALDRFGLEVVGRMAVDAGASTGGFTDCLLQHGCRRVIAVDVGRGQLHPRLAKDARVCSLERTNIRLLDGRRLATSVAARRPEWQVAEDLRVPLVTVDLSFISLRTVAPVVAGALLARGGDLVALVKPQFEAGRAEASRGKGVIRDPGVWRSALLGAASAIEEAGAGIMDAMPSPLRGASGNREFLLHGRAGAPLRGTVALETLAASVVPEAGGEQA